MDQLFCGERTVNRVPEVHLRGKSSTHRVGLFFRVEDGAVHSLNSAVVAAISGARRNPWEELLRGALLVGLGLFESFARDLNVEILRVGQSQGGGQVDGIGLIRVGGGGRSRGLRL